MTTIADLLDHADALIIADAESLLVDLDLGALRHV